ncbi:LPS export ABC transporter periplasmic protein LptC [bacterium]|nr:LPS export ABC transporter periplasmic protein LptC [bacterium]
MAIINKNKLFLFAIVIAFVALSIFSFMSPKLMLISEKRPNRPAFEFRDVHIQQYNLDHVDYVVTSSVATIDPATNKVSLSQVQAQFFPRSGSLMTVQSPQATISFDGKSMHLVNAVISLSSFSGLTTISAKIFEWDTEVGDFRCRQGVVLRMPNYIIEGDELAGTLPLAKVRINGRVKAEITNATI